MNLFHKNKPLKTTAEGSTSQTETPQPAEGEQEKNLTIEERARAWWLAHYGETMPGEVVQWIKQLARAEARRQTMAATLLTTQQRNRLEDARKLAETKLRNVEASLQRLHTQREWMHRFTEKKHELAEHRSRLYTVNKQLAMQTEEERELMRFETFETIQETFQRMTLTEDMARNSKLAQSELIRLLDEARQTETEHQKMLQQRADESEEATKQMMATRDHVIEASRIAGARNILELDKTSTENLATAIAQQKQITDKEIEEMKAEAENVAEQIAARRTQRQTMEPHQALMEHGEMVLTLLEKLGEMRTEMAHISHQQNEELHRQQEENDMLGRVFAEYQNVEADIKTLNTELHMHRQQNLGRSSYSLQERAMELKSRRQMLLAAQSLWNRIQLGYRLIEEKTQTVNRLRLSLDNLTLNIGNLEAKLAPMRQLCHEKEYTLTLSKSQNVIQLRSDLREGACCTVCGATHHPYHSDTMLEQSKLIGELRTDFELLQAELSAQEEQLQQLKLQQAADTARRDVEEDALSRLRQRQMEDVHEWNVFAPLDRTFAECSPSTNAEARTAMLRQLIENTAYDADDAQKELDEYNYHQTRINEINELLSQKEQHRSDLTVRLNELNTGCQVLARKTEQTRQMRAKLQEQYTRLYERLNKYITLNEWYSQWQQNSESIHLRIEQMMEQWGKLGEELSQLHKQQEALQGLLEEKLRLLAFLDTLAAHVRDEGIRRKEIWAEDEKNYDEMLGGQDIKEYFNRAYQQLLDAHRLENGQRDHTALATKHLAELQGQLLELTRQGQALDDEAIAAKSKLDLWIRKFNANHPPVQYAELQQAFASNRDWNSIRERIRATRIEAMLEQARVDNLRSAIVALQAEGMRLDDPESEEAIQSMVAQQQQLEQQRQEILMQLAEQRIALQRHDACQAQLKAEEEELYAKLNVEN